MTKTLPRGRAAPARPPEANPFPALDILADLGRQQMSVAADASCALLRGFEAMRQIQQKAAHDASVRHEAVSEQLHKGCAPADLMSIQASLLQGDWQEASKYWQELAATALEMQVEMMSCASHLVDSETAVESVSAVEAFDAIPGMKAFFPFLANGPAKGAARPAR